MKRVALVAFPLAVFGFVLLAFLLVVRWRRDSVPTEATIGQSEPADHDVDVDLGRTLAADIDVLSGYDEEHETELEAARRHAPHHPGPAQLPPGLVGRKTSSSGRRAVARR